MEQECISLPTVGAKITLVFMVYVAGVSIAEADPCQSILNPYASLKAQILMGHTYEYPAIKDQLEQIANRWGATGSRHDPEDGSYEALLVLKADVLREGAKLARQVNDPFAADWYEHQANHMDLIRSLLHFFNPEERYRENLASIK